jgi:glycerophosphoryl diester phosphodiesterase
MLSCVGPRRHRLHPYLDQPAPIAIAHRGGAEEAPENTLAAFGAAVALGYRFLETDAHVTRDGVVVAFHDPRLDTVTDRTGAIAALSITEVEAADAGYAFSPDGGRSFPFRGGGLRIPRLEELLGRWPQAHVNIDPKTDACVEPLVAVIDRLRAWDRVGFGAFSDRRLRRLRALSRGRACTSMGPRAVAVARIAAVCGRMPVRAQTASRSRCAEGRSRSSPLVSCGPPIARASRFTSGQSTTSHPCTSCSTSVWTAS